MACGFPAAFIILWARGSATATSTACANRRSAAVSPSGLALLAGQEDGRDAAGEACCAEGFVCEPVACPRAAGSTLQRCRGEVVERTFAHMYETGGMRRVWVRGHENVRKRVLLQAAACNIGLLLRSQTGIGTPRSLQGRAVSAICRLIGRLIDRWGRLTRAWGFKLSAVDIPTSTTTLAGSIPHRHAQLPEQRNSANRLRQAAFSEHTG